MGNTICILTEKIRREYELMREMWFDMTVDELIENAEKIAAAKFVSANIESCVTDDEAEYLLSFKEPLSAVIETIMYRYDPRNMSEREWFCDHLYGLLDRSDLDADYCSEEKDGMTMK